MSSQEQVHLDSEDYEARRKEIGSIINSLEATALFDQSVKLEPDTATKLETLINSCTDEEVQRIFRSASSILQDGERSKQEVSTTPMLKRILEICAHHWQTEEKQAADIDQV